MIILSDIEKIREWMKGILEASRFSVERIKFSESDFWYFEDGFLRNRSKAFFSIVGLRYRYTPEEEFRYQPIILQKEIGIQGLIVSRIKNVPHILIQAKIEPGNQGIIQVAPALQATRSNYLAKHMGKVPDFLSEFMARTSDQVMVDQLQSEQGTRFFEKQNRNMAIYLDSVREPDNELFAWVPIRTVLDLLSIDHMINSDANSILGALFLTHGNTLLTDIDFKYRDLAHQLITGFSNKDLLSSLQRITREKVDVFHEGEIISLFEMPGWEIHEGSVFSADGLFGVDQIKVHTKFREVAHWDQPIINSQNIGEIGLLLRKKENKWFALLQMRSEPGIFHRLELTTSVHLTDNNERDQIFQEELLKVIKFESQDNQIYTASFSEEGSRFFKDINTYRITITQKDFNLPERFFWAPVSILKSMIIHNHVFTNEARGMIAKLFGALI